MLEIHPSENIQSYTGYLEKLKLSSADIDIKIVEAIDHNNVTGFCIFSYAGERVILYAVEYGEDLYLCDGLIRSVLFKASMLGIDRAEFAFADLSAVRKLRFLEKESCELSSIQSIMNGCENCK